MDRKEDPVQEIKRLDDYVEKLFQIMDNMHEGGYEKTIGFTAKEYSDAYTIIYNFCINRMGNEALNLENMYTKYIEIIKTYLIKRVYASLMVKTKEDLLVEIWKRWETFNGVMLRLLRSFFSYLDRTFVVTYNKVPLRVLGISLFRQTVFHDAIMIVLRGFIQLLENDRMGVLVNRHLLRNISDLYLLMRDNEGAESKIYETLHRQIIERSEDFYKRKSWDLSSELGVSEYLHETEILANKENDRLNEILSSASNLTKSTKTILSKLFDEYFLIGYNKMFEDEKGLSLFLSECKIKDLSCIYRLYSRINDKFNHIWQFIRDHIYEKGNEIICEKIESNLQSETKETFDDPKFIKKIIVFHKKNKDILFPCFGNNSNIKFGFRTGMSKFLNKSVGEYGIPEYLAGFVSYIMKSDSRKKITEAERDNYIEEIVQIFNLLQEKDVFLSFYKRNLAMRILKGKSIGFEEEKTFVSKIKEECGPQFTSAIEGMFNDYDSAQFTISQYKESVQNRGMLFSIESNILVLSKGNWSIPPEIPIFLPSKLQDIKDDFMKFYLSKGNLYNLEFVHSLSTIVILMKCLEKKYEMTVSVHQFMILLVLENENEMDSLNLAERLEIPVEMVYRSIHSLCCGKFKIVLKSSSGNKISNSDKFSLNREFTSPHRILQIPIIYQEEQFSREKVSDDRQLAIEAQIVRIMKARKTLQFHELIQEVISSLKQFHPSTKSIKSRIDSLIERDYLERDMIDMNLIKYLA